MPKLSGAVPIEQCCLATYVNGLKRSPQLASHVKRYMAWSSRRKMKWDHIKRNSRAFLARLQKLRQIFSAITREQVPSSTKKMEQISQGITTKDGINLTSTGIIIGAIPIEVIWWKIKIILKTCVTRAIAAKLEDQRSSVHRVVWKQNGIATI